MSEGSVDGLCDENDGCGSVYGVHGDLGMAVFGTEEDFGVGGRRGTGGPRGGGLLREPTEIPFRQG